MVTRALSRRLGTGLIVAGITLLCYAASVVFWRDPVTDLYTLYQQHEMQSELHREEAVWHQRAQTVPATTSTRPKTHVPGRRGPDLTAVIAGERRLAGGFANSTRNHDGRPIGTITIPRIGLSTIFVEGTDYWNSLTRGPGRYAQTSFPGLPGTTAIAGHRTTWSAPFRHIDSIRKGDRITLVMPYGTFVYRVTGHKIVRNNDWSIIRNVGYQQLVLSACHPLYSASHRWVVFARLSSIQPPTAEGAAAA